MHQKKMYLRIRNICGLLGMLLPWLSLLGAALVDVKPGSSWWHSISATYYQTPALAAVLTAASIVLMTYDGYSKLDNVITTLSGVFGLLIVLFPCSVGWLAKSDGVGFFQVPMRVSSVIHNASAAAFFILLAFNCVFLFTKYDAAAGMTKEKETRNLIYRVCGWGMVAAMVLLVILQQFLRGWIVMIAEIVLLQLFGFSWLVKGGVFFKDKEPASVSVE